MLTPEIHTTDVVNVLGITTSMSFILETSGLSGGAIFCTLLVAAWAIARNDSYKRWQAFTMFIGAVGCALIFTGGTAKLINHLFGLELPLQWLASTIAFIFIDKPAKDWVIGFFSKKVQDLEVKND